MLAHKAPPASPQTQAIPRQPRHIRSHPTLATSTINASSEHTRGLPWIAQEFHRRRAGERGRDPKKP